MGDLGPLQTQEERMKETVLEAVWQERRRADERWAEQRAEWEAERLRDRETLAQAIEEALTHQRRIGKVGDYLVLSLKMVPAVLAEIMQKAVKMQDNDRDNKNTCLNIL